MAKYVWCEDSASGFQFWNALFGNVYPDFLVETKHSSSELSKAVGSISDDGNIYYIIIDTAVDNPDVQRELSRLNRNISGKTNVRIIKINSFEFSLLSFEHLENWVFAENDELKENRRDLLEAKNIFVKLITNGGSASDINAFKTVYAHTAKKNTEKIAAYLLYNITRNTGFETDKSQVGACFINSCCEWSERQENDICGLDNDRPTVNDKMNMLINHSVLYSAFREAGLE